MTDDRLTELSREPGPLGELAAELVEQRRRLRECLAIVTESHAQIGDFLPDLKDRLARMMELWLTFLEENGDDPPY